MMQTSLTSLRRGYRAMVFGATGGIGAAVCAQLAADPRCATVYAGARGAFSSHGKTQPFRFDLKDEASIAAAAERAASDGDLDLVFVATGALQTPTLRPEKTWRALDATALVEAFAINTVGPALIAKHTLSRLHRPGKAVFAVLSARVGSIADNRLGGWHAYRASKAALNMLVRTCAIELATRAPAALCIGLHPGTVDTGLSRPFQSAALEKTLKTPDQSAAALLGVINQMEADASGKLWDYAGTEIPF